MSLIWVLSLAFSVLAANEDKIDFKKLDVESPVSDVFYCGVRKEVILILTDDRTVYRSENSGNSWKPVSVPGPSKVKRIIFSKADNRLVGFLGREGKNWYSDDCGKTLTVLNNDILIEDVRLHPTMRTWALAVAWSQCKDSDTNCVKTRALYLTQDLGVTWTSLLEYVVQFGWGTDGLTPEIVQTLPAERIYVTQNTNPGAGKFTGWNYDIDFIRSDDFFQSQETIVPHGNKFLLANRFILVATAVEGDEEEVQLMVSHDFTIETFNKAKFPFKRLPEHGYTLLDTTEGSVFINVNHYKGFRGDGTVVASDSTGSVFSISLHHNVRDHTGYCDFERVKGLEGIYIANVHDKDYYPSDEEDKETIKSVRKFQKTYISFDKGGEWSRIEAPQRDSAGKRIVCVEDCFLNLHSTTSEYSSLYSNANAIGLVLATGNVGKFLSYKQDELNTYMSRDGGVNWIEVIKGEHVYEMGDHGAIVVMADSKKATDKLLYSWNEGLSWETLTLDEPLEVENIVTEPTATSQKFLIYGEYKGKGVTVAVDFSSFHEPICRGPDSPGASDSDYEVWTPQGGKSGSCLMGHRTEYVRRKQSAECYNGQEFERQRVTDNCECVLADFECDEGYEREEDSEVCKRNADFVDEEEECDENGMSYVRTGYRRVPGNTCEKGVSAQYEPTPVPCSYGKKELMVGVAVVIVAAAAYFVWRYRERLGELKGLIKKPEFDRSGFFSDLTKAPEGIDEEEEMIITGKGRMKAEEYDPRH